MIDLRQGDCLELMKDIPDKSVDMILCDLPYGQTARNKWDSVIPFEPLWEQYKRIIKDNSAIVLLTHKRQLVMSGRSAHRNIKGTVSSQLITTRLTIIAMTAQNAFQGQY